MNARVQDLYEKFKSAKSEDLVDTTKYALDEVRGALELLYKQPSALSSQVGGDHYKDLPIQPMEYSLRNNLNAGQHTVIKYVTRYKSGKGTPRENLEKAIHTLQLMIEIEKL